MYLIQLGHIVYQHKDGSPFTLPEAMREVYGVGQARILRLDGTPAVLNAGSSSEVMHAPSGRRVRITR
jgi:ferric-dicitrate binding protein FerR (iron transport regulator)